MTNEPKYKEYPSGRVLCCIKRGHGAIVCLSGMHGSIEDRRKEALRKAKEIAERYDNTV